jgi:hypothetical protein
VRSGGEVRANWGPVGVRSITFAEPAEPAIGASSRVAEVSIDGGGGCRLDARSSESNRELRLPNEDVL